MPMERPTLISFISMPSENDTKIGRDPPLGRLLSEGLPDVRPYAHPLHSRACANADSRRPS